MTPEQSAAFINAQATLFLVELAALKVSMRDPRYLEAERRSAFNELLENARMVLGHNSVLTVFEGAHG